MQAEKKYNDLGSGITVTIFGILYLAFSFSIKVTKLGGSTSSRMFPQLIAVIFIFLGVMLIIRSLKHRVVGGQEGQAPAKFGKKYQRVLSVFVISFLYVLLMNILGFIIATPLYLYAFILVLSPKDGKKNHLRDVVIAIVATALLYFGFRYGFSMMLPRGIL